MSIDKSKTYPRLKEIHETPVGTATYGAELPFRMFMDNIAIGYLLDEGHQFRYLKRSDLEAIALSEDRLHALALENVEADLDSTLQVTQGNGVTMLHGSGNHESSVLLLPRLLEKLGCSPTAAIGVPTRDVCMWADATDDAVVNRLAALIAEVHRGCRPSERVSGQILLRDDRSASGFRYREPRLPDVMAPATATSKAPWWACWKR